jgi:radical SAM superfamily enzyme YgiQ (UPF0313 family)
MTRKIYLIQPIYRDSNGRLLQGNSLFYSSLALPALSPTIPPDWQKEFCFEYFTNVNYETDAPVIGISTMGYDVLHGSEIAREFRRRGKQVLFGGHQVPFSKELLAPVSNAFVFGNPNPREMKAILEDAASGSLAREYYCGLEADHPFDYSILAGHPMKFIPVLGTIGCKNNCDFCCTAALGHGQFHLRHMAAIRADLIQANRLGRYAVFVDANLYNDREHLLRILSCMTEMGSRLRWGAQATIDIGDDTEVLKRLRAAGCILLLLGVETLSQANMDGLNKHLDVTRHAERVAQVRKAGIAVGGYFILGLDGDSRETFGQTFEFIHQSRIALPILNLLLPAPGTRVFERLRGQGRLLLEDPEALLRNNERYATASSHCLFQPQRMSPTELEAAFLVLYNRLASYREIARRCMGHGPLLDAILLKLNLEMRKDLVAMRNGSGRRSQRGNRVGQGVGAASLGGRP